MMIKKLLLVPVLLMALLFLVSCSVGEASRQLIKTNDGIRNIEETYASAIEFRTVPEKAGKTELYLNNLNYPGNLGPFPTKSLQSYIVLRQYGIIDSLKVDLGGFYLLEGPQTEITNTVQNNANLIQDGATTEETVINIMEWEHRNLNCSESEALQYFSVRRERTADDIISSACAIGCTDFTIVFVALARAKGIPATVTETVREKWIANIVWYNDWDVDWNPPEGPGKKYGHFFSEVYLFEESVWIVADPTANKLTGRDDNGYYPSGPDGNKRFMLFERGLDSWDYGIETDTEYGEIVKNRYYVELGDQP